MLGEHLEHAAVRRQLTAVGVFRTIIGEPQLLARLVDRIELVGRGLVGPEDAEVRHVPAHGVAQEAPQRPRVLGFRGARLVDGDGVVSEIRRAEGFAHQPAVGVRIGAHASCALRRERLQLRNQPSLVVEQLVRAIAAQPFFELLQMAGILVHAGERYLMRAPEAFHLVAVHLLGAGPALRTTQHDHRPARAAGLAACARLLLDPANLQHAVLQSGGHLLVHRLGLAALDEIGRPSVALEQVAQLLVRDARQQRGVVDLVAVEMQDRQHGAVADRVQELVGMPRRRERSGLRFTVPHHHRDEQIGVIEGRAEGVGDAVAELAAFVDRARSLGRAVAADASGEREFLEELGHPFFVFALVRVHLRVGPFEVDRRQHARGAVAGAGEKDGVEVVLVDQPIEMDVREAQAGARSPVAEQTLLDVLGLQRRPEQRIAAQVDHAGGQVRAGPPVCVHLPKLVAGQPLGRYTGLRVFYRRLHLCHHLRHECSSVARATVTVVALTMRPCVPDAPPRTLRSGGPSRSHG